MTKKDQNAILEIARRNLPAMEQRGDFETRMNDTESICYEVHQKTLDII